MSPSAGNPADDQLDALIAKIHGLAGVVESDRTVPPGVQPASTEEPVSPVAGRPSAAGHVSGGGQEPLVGPPVASPRAVAMGRAPAPPAGSPPRPDVLAGAKLPVEKQGESSPQQLEPTRHPTVPRETPEGGGDGAAGSLPGHMEPGGYAEFAAVSRQRHIGTESFSIPSGSSQSSPSGSSQSSLLSDSHLGGVPFEPSRDEPWRPPKPGTLEETGVPETVIEQIMLRYLLAGGEATGRRVADQLKLAFGIIEPILERLKSDQVVGYRRGTETGDYIYVLTEAGRKLARGLAADCTYYGACPVSLAEYVLSVKAQTVEGQQPRKDDLERAFSDLLIEPQMLTRLGPAVNSGRGMFLYGYPGNGKTSIAERVTSAFGKYVWVPRSVIVDGEIMRIFDQMNHEVAMPERDQGILDQSLFDKRWVRIKRPTIVAGGELTMDMLEVQGNAETGISEAPLQLKSNCGTLVIDDFGRQKMSVDQLLNRWIVPLEKRYDFLNMRSGKKIQVPFDQLVVFSTNLEPKDLVDDAFLRRIPYKIEVRDPSEVHFRQLFEIMCRVLNIPYRGEPIDYLIERHYRPVKRPYRNCQPRDLLMQVRNYCQYMGYPLELRNEYFDFAADVYFSIM